MNTSLTFRSAGLVLALMLLAPVAPAAAAVTGIGGTLSGSTRTFNLSAREGYIDMPDGSSLYAWGYADSDNGDLLQYPGPTLIAKAGETLVVNLTNHLDRPVSIAFPGQPRATATGGVVGLIAREAAAGGTVSYTFQVPQPGTYQYHSASEPELQIEMGLVGALIVRPATAGRAYAHSDTIYDDEVLMVLTEIDPVVHDLAEWGRESLVDPTNFWPTIWLINGRAAPDTMLPDYVPWLPHQPYGAMVMSQPGERILVRMVGAGRHAHPFHTHGQHMLIIARDGRLLGTTPVTRPNLAEKSFTATVAPGQTVDALFQWTGNGLGWDLYGHRPGDALAPGEDPADHGKPIPVTLPTYQDLALGESWSGSPFLGQKGPMPPGQGVMNTDGSFTYMWHSHNEKEMVTFDIFPGGMMTMFMVMPPAM